MFPKGEQGSALLFQDPWIRNEVWRFDRRQPHMADRSVLIRRLLTRGLVPGFSLAVVTAGAVVQNKYVILITQTLSLSLSGIHYYFESKNEHGHH